MSKKLTPIGGIHSVAIAELHALEKLEAFNEAKAEWLKARDELISAMIKAGSGRQVRSEHFRLSEHKVSPKLDSTKLCAALKMNYVELYKKYGSINKCRTVLSRILK